MLKSANKKTVLVGSHPNKWCFRFGNVPVEFPSILIHLAGLSPFQICPTRWKALDVSFWVCVKTRTGFQNVWKKKQLSWTFSGFQERHWLLPIGSMYGIYTNIGCILMVNVTIYSTHGSYGLVMKRCRSERSQSFPCGYGSELGNQWSRFYLEKFGHLVQKNTFLEVNDSSLKKCYPKKTWFQLIVFFILTHPFAATFPEERRCHRILWHGSSSTIDNRRHGDDRWGTPLWIVFLHGHGDYPLVMTKSLRTWSLAQSK